MKLNCGINLSKLGKDLLNGRLKKPTDYVWVTASQTLKKPKK